MQDRQIDDRAPAPAAPVRFTPAIRFRHQQRLAAAVAFVCALLMLTPPRAGEQNLAVPVRFAQVTLAVRAPSLLRLDLPAGQYYVSPASLGYFSQNNEFVFTSDVQRGLVYGYVERDPLAPGDSRGAVYLVEISAPSDSDLFLSEYLQAIRQRVDQENLTANQLRLAREQDSAEAQKSRRLAAQPLGFTRQELSDGSFSAWVERVIHDYSDLLPEMPTALQAETLDQVELKRLYYQSEAASMDQMLASFELQMTLAQLPKPRIESLLQLGDSKTVQDGGLEQLRRMRDHWLLRQDELQQELAVSRQWLDRLDTVAPVSRQPQSLLKPMSGQLPALAPPGMSVDPRRQLERGAVSGRVAIAEAELNQIKETLRLADGLKRYIDQGGSGRDLQSFKMLAVPRSSFAPLSLDHLDGFALVENLSRDQGAGLPLLLKLARAFEGLDSEQPLRVPAMRKDEGLATRQLEVPYGLLLLDRSTRLAQAGVHAPQQAGRSVAEKGDGQAPSAADLNAQLNYVLSDPAASEMADSNLGYLAFLNWYGKLLLAAPSHGWASPAEDELSPGPAQSPAQTPAGRGGRQPGGGAKSAAADKPGTQKAGAKKAGAKKAGAKKASGKRAGDKKPGSWE